MKSDSSSVLDATPAKTRIRFTVAYDGTDFCGWQKQNHESRPSVCQTLEQALTKIFGHKITLFASGRTDAGVHALNQVCHFETTKLIDPEKKWDLAWAMLRYLPSSIVVKKVWIAPPEFHATLSAEKKTYRYMIYNAQRANPFLHRYMGWIRRPIDIDHLNESSKYLLGHHDFKSFQCVGTEVRTTDRTIYRAEWTWKRPQVAEFNITGSGFLKQMVRNIVGTQLLLEQKGRPALDMKKIIEKQDRREAGPVVEPQGLYLLRVYYPQDLDKKCREL